LKTLISNQDFLIYYFALGDALGKDFEFITPTQEQLKEKFYGSSPLTFTDDTFLLLSTIHAMKKSEIITSGTIDYKFCKDTVEYLKEWYESSDLRGIGNTTYAALKQIYRYDFEADSDLEFQLSSRAYETSISAGNGILSRALPLCLCKIDFDPRLVKWLQLTHLHIEGHKAVLNLMKYIHNETIPTYPIDQDSKGFYAHETLGIAVNAVSRSKNLYEVFTNSQVSDGDNDSNAALACALWYLKNGANENDLILLNRFIKADLKRMYIGN
jgi:ADP-ribosylglycohydrolase